MTKKTKKTTKKTKKPVTKLSDGIVAVYNDSYYGRKTKFFTNEAALLRAINSGDFTYANNKTTHFFRLAGQEVKVNITVEQIPVTEKVTKATGVSDKKKKAA